MNVFYQLAIGSLFTSFSTLADVQGIENNTGSQSAKPLTPSAEDLKNANGVLPTVDSIPPSAYDNNVPPETTSKKGSAAGHLPNVKDKSKKSFRRED